MADKKKILIIDDDPDIIDSVDAVLTAHDFEVFSANNGKDGIEAVDKFNPDMVICDMMMEQVDSGSKVARYIKEKRNDLPVYLLSSIGNATQENIEIEGIGFNGVFQKPVSPDNLVKTVKETLHI
jgi:DNA-binding response OmpR family regulator